MLAETDRDTMRGLLYAANAEIDRLNRALAASRAAYHERPGNPGELAALRGALAKASAEAGEAKRERDAERVQNNRLQAQLSEANTKRDEAFTERDKARKEKINADLREKAALHHNTMQAEHLDRVIRERDALQKQLAEWSRASCAGSVDGLGIADRKRLAAILAWTRGGASRTFRQRTDCADRFEVYEKPELGKNYGRLTIGTLAEISDRLGL